MNFINHRVVQQVNNDSHQYIKQPRTLLLYWK